MLFTCSVDKTGAIWDCEAGERIKKLKGHTSFVNTCCPTRRGVALLATGSDDGNIKVSCWAGKIVHFVSKISGFFSLYTYRFGTSERKELSTH